MEKQPRHQWNASNKKVENSQEIQTERNWIARNTPVSEEYRKRDTKIAISEISARDFVQRW